MSDTPKQSAFKLPLKIGRKYPQDVEDESGKLVCCAPENQAAEIVQAVNSLPLLQEVEKELQDIVGRFAIALEVLGNPPKTVEMNTAKAHAVLSRLRAARDQQPKKE